MGTTSRKGNTGMSPKILTILFFICVFMINVMAVDQELEKDTTEDVRELGSWGRKKELPFEEGKDYCEQFEDQKLNINYYVIHHEADNGGVGRRLGNANKVYESQEGTFRIIQHKPWAELSILKGDFKADINDIKSRIICQKTKFRLRSESNGKQKSILCVLTDKSEILISHENDAMNAEFLLCLGKSMATRADYQSLDQDEEQSKEEKLRDCKEDDEEQIPFGESCACGEGEDRRRCGSHGNTYGRCYDGRCQTKKIRDCKEDDEEQIPFGESCKCGNGLCGSSDDTSGYCYDKRCHSEKKKYHSFDQDEEAKPSKEYQSMDPIVQPNTNPEQSKEEKQAKDSSDYQSFEKVEENNRNLENAVINEERSLELTDDDSNLN